MLGKKTANRRRQANGIAQKRNMGSAARLLLENPMARELLAAALIQIAAMLVESQSARGSTTRRVVGSLGDVGKLAGKFGGATMAQALDKLRAYWSNPESESEPRPQHARRPPIASLKLSKKAPKRGRGNRREATGSSEPSLQGE
jgi:hypothetical protein